MQGILYYPSQPYLYRAKGEHFGYTESVSMDTITTNEMVPDKVDMEEVEENVSASFQNGDSMATSSSEPYP